MNKKQIYLAGMVTAVFILGSIIWWIITPKWVSLFTYELSGQSAQEVMNTLEQSGIEYRIDEQSKSILVRNADMRRSHGLLREYGLPKEPGDGLEMFNSSDYGLSEFAQNINYQRGVEEELARTIMRMDGIKSVRVHLTIKKDSLFEDRKQEPKASIVVGFLDGVSYDPGKIRGIQEVVAAAISNLRAENVTVITSQGNILSASASTDLIAGGSTVEDKYRNIVTELLDGLLGSGEYKLSVNVRMDQRKKITVEEKIIPEKSGKGFPHKIRSTSRKNDDSDRDSPLSVQSSSDEEYLYSKEKSEIVYPVGEIANISVGLVILTEVDPKMLDAIEDLILAALAMDPQRGDKIGIVSAPSNQAVESLDSMPVPQSPVHGGASAHDGKQYLWWLAILSCLFMFSTICLAVAYFGSRRSQFQPLSKAEKELLVNDLVKWLERR